LARVRAPCSVAVDGTLKVLMSGGNAMPTKGSTILALAALSLLAAPAIAATPTSDEAEIRAVQDRIAAAINAKDPDAIVKNYAPDVFVFDLPPPRQYVGEKAWRDDWKGVFATAAGAGKLDVQDLVIKVSGDVAYSHAIDHYVSDGPNGTKVELNLRATDVYRKIGGKWLIVQEHLSVPIDMASGKPDMLSKP
jgi:uncharacterized protein (TIGR02246 family)